MNMVNKMMVMHQLALFDHIVELKLLELDLEFVQDNQNPSMAED